jgi:hypothetical protein
LHFFFSNKVDLSQGRSAVILKKRLHWNYLHTNTQTIFLSHTHTHTKPQTLSPSHTHSFLYFHFALFFFLFLCITVSLLSFKSLSLTLSFPLFFSVSSRKKHARWQWESFPLYSPSLSLSAFIFPMFFTSSFFSSSL